MKMFSFALLTISGTAAGLFIGFQTMTMYHQTHARTNLIGLAMGGAVAGMVASALGIALTNACSKNE